MANNGCWEVVGTPVFAAGETTITLDGPLATNVLGGKITKGIPNDVGLAYPGTAVEAGEQATEAAEMLMEITAVNQGTKKFTVEGDFTGLFTYPYVFVVVELSTGNNATYTLVGAALNGGNTEIEVVEAIASAIADGQIKPMQSTNFLGTDYVTDTTQGCGHDLTLDVTLVS